MFKKLIEKEIQIIINTRGLEEKMTDVLKCRLTDESVFSQINTISVKNLRDNLVYDPNNILVIGAQRDRGNNYHPGYTKTIAESITIGGDPQKGIDGNKLWVHRKTLVMRSWLKKNKTVQDNIMFFDDDPHNIQYARENGFKNSYCHEIEKIDNKTGVITIIPPNPATLLANFISSKLPPTESPTPSPTPSPSPSPTQSPTHHQQHHQPNGVIVEPIRR